MSAPGHHFSGAYSTPNPFRQAILEKMDAQRGIDFELPKSRPAMNFGFCNVLSVDFVVQIVVLHFLFNREMILPK